MSQRSRNLGAYPLATDLPALFVEPGRIAVDEAVDVDRKLSRFHQVPTEIEVTAVAHLGHHGVFVAVDAEPRQ